MQDAMLRYEDERSGRRPQAATGRDQAPSEAEEEVSTGCMTSCTLSLQGTLHSGMCL